MKHASRQHCTLATRYSQNISIVMIAPKLLVTIKVLWKLVNGIIKNNKNNAGIIKKCTKSETRGSYFFMN